MGFGMTFDTTITIGNLAEITSIIVGGIIVAIRMGGDLRVMKVDMKHLKDTVNTLSSAFDKLGTILTQVAVQDVRLVAMEKRLDEMAHGRGFVQRELTGEYPPR